VDQAKAQPAGGLPATSKIAQEVRQNSLKITVVAYRQPVARAGIELIRGSASDSALDTLLERGLVERNAHQLLVTTRAFLDYAGLRDLADLPSPGADEATGGHAGA
jgi:chromosome segregation and condensation protein ScpB